MMTANGGIEDRLRGRQAGADVYLSKPADLRELAAAVQGLIGRLNSAAPTRSSAGRAGWTLDVGKFELKAPNGKSAALTANELALLSRMTSPCAVVVPRGELLAVLGYDPADPSNRNLDAALRRLRLKVEEKTGAALPVRTVHSVGYLIAESVQVLR
jgi:DNA-binding response OmpR family regulator